MKKDKENKALEAKKKEIAEKKAAHLKNKPKN